MSKVTKKDVEKTIKNCIRNKDYFTAKNYYEKYKEEFKIDFNKLLKEIDKKKESPTKSGEKEGN